jgi:L-alanine-DL-glutamate epimerase-like enolase superfamily enzyme
MTRRSLLSATTALPLFAGQPRQKIVSVKAAPLPLLPTARFGTKEFTSDHDPARWRWFGPFSQLPGAILVQIRTAQGITGYGMGGGGTAAVHIIESHLKDLLIGANALNMELLWDQMFSSSTFYGRRGVAIMAISGLDLALWDIAGQAAARPVWQLLGGAAKDKVLAYYTGGDPENGMKLGFKAYKLGLYEGIADTSKESMWKLLERLKQVRGIIGYDNKLMIDCLCRWNVEYTLEFAERAQDLKLYFIEEPLLPDDVPGFQRLCLEVKGTRIALGEHEFTHYGFQEVLRNKASHILQPDLTWCGGLTDIRRVATIAASHGVPVMPHRGSSLFGIHLVISHPNCPMAESFGTGERGNEMMARLTAPFKDGYYYPPEKPGLGVELPADVLKKHVPTLAD